MHHFHGQLKPCACGSAPLIQPAAGRMWYVACPQRTERCTGATLPFSTTERASLFWNDAAPRVAS